MQTEEKYILFIKTMQAETCMCVFDNHFKDCNTKNFLFAILPHGGKGWPST